MCVEGRKFQVGVATDPVIQSVVATTIIIASPTQGAHFHPSIWRRRRGLGAATNMATRAARLSVELLADAGGSAVWGIVRHSAQTGVTELPGSGQDATGSGSGQKILPKPDSLEVWVGSGRVRI
ncbi:hypothetical protein PCANC_17597 [Puccinia coronata f. sp. avenae]|uniref:Uncharacterized protein n=1 Tax=Puccinia coronata f. sp. avenae TaxID=200324 RepID=A0A2N5VMY2_9BASI|nr:hypothetical protein PCANC_17597 [Puccinia coronata f. sp. avenae]